MLLSLERKLAAAPYEQWIVMSGTLWLIEGKNPTLSFT
jgi:hypothetical protein